MDLFLPHPYLVAAAAVLAALMLVCIGVLVGLSAIVNRVPASQRREINSLAHLTLAFIFLTSFASVVFAWLSQELPL